MTAPVLSNLIVYLVAQLTEVQATFGKTKLVKLLYLVDVEIYRRYSKTLSGLTWLFHYYGPYASEIDAALRQLDLDIPQEEVLTKAGYRAFTFKPPWDVEARLEAYIPGPEKLIVNRVLHRWGLEELNPILDYVYFHTEPMKNAKRGDVLDFSTIMTGLSRLQAERKVELPSDKAAQFKARFQELKEKRPQRAVEALRPIPRLDDVYEKGALRMNAAESYRLPSGRIRLDNETKRQLRDVGEQEESG